MQIIQINTTAFNEEDFYIFTSLTEEQVSNVIAPMVKLERESSNVFYVNQDYVNALKIVHPSALVVYMAHFPVLLSF